MAEEPQKARPAPLRLQADYQRLRDEERILRDKARSGDTSVSDALEAKEREVADYIRAHKRSL